MESLEYVEIARCRDDHRHNMTGVYRDYERLVATDGFRLHMVDGLPRVEKPHFVDGRDVEFPNYETALLPDAKFGCSAKLNSNDTRRLKAMLGVFGRKTNCGVIIKVEDQQLVVKIPDSEKTFGGFISFPCEEVSEPFSLKVNLKYLIEAIVPGKIWPTEIHYSKEGRGIYVKYPAYKFTALIMGMRA